MKKPLLALLLAAVMLLVTPLAYATLIFLHTNLLGVERGSSDRIYRDWHRQSHARYYG